ncbi:unnamed protein product [Cuscuta epithymum]|uniref:Uncharacterized protein n=1 Tax=Cuscuta epithymum TaxID=186058 RepID=A0AAV0EYS0_9ASTE|nr:unnamed protein product [Cuscuta epithymum]
MACSYTFTHIFTISCWIKLNTGAVCGNLSKKITCVLPLFFKDSYENGLIPAKTKKRKTTDLNGRKRKNEDFGRSGLSGSCSVLLPPPEHRRRQSITTPPSPSPTYCWLLPPPGRRSSFHDSADATCGVCRSRAS